MGDRKKKANSFEDEALDVLNSADDDDDFAKEAAAVTAEPDKPEAWSDIKDPEMRQYAQETLTPEVMEHTKRLYSDPAYFLRQLVGAGSRYAGGAIGAGGVGGAASQIARGAVGGGVAGAGQNVAHDEERNMLQRALNMAQDTSVGAAVGGAWAAGSQAVAGAARGIGDFFRRQQMGLSQSDYEDIIKQRGLQAASNMGQLPDRIGATNQLMPQSSGELMRRAQAAKTAFGRAEGAAVDAAADAVGPINGKDATLRRLVELERRSAADPSSYGEGQQANYNAMRSRLSRTPPVETPRDLLELKRQYENAAGYGQKMAGPADSMRAEANAKAASAARGQLRDTMQAAGPELNQQFTQNAQRFGEAATVQDAARASAARTLAGGGGQQNPIGAAARSAWDYASSLGGNVARGVEADARSLGATSGFVGGQVSQAFGEGRGHEAPTAIREVLQTKPYELGKYARELMDAEEAGQLNSAIHKLNATDEEFRTQIYPRILQLTAAQR